MLSLEGAKGRAMSSNELTAARLTGAGLNLIAQALSIFDRDLRLAVCNRRYREMFDFPAAFVTPGIGFEDTIRFLVQRGEYGPQDDPERAVRVRVEAARAFVPHYLERMRPNGRWISVEGAPLAQGGWVTTYTDITEIKLQESLLRARSEELAGELGAHAERLAQANRALAATNAALEEAKRELTEMEARTRLTTEMMPAHIAHVDPALVYTYSNRRLSTVLPGIPAEIVGLPVRDAVGPETFARILPWLEAALAGEANVHEFTHDASGRRIRAAFTPGRMGAGPVTGVYILSMDVTEEAQARAALAQTHKRELAAQLTSGLAHDFANLLTIILGLQGRLVRLPGLPAEALEQARATVAAARRGGTLLDRIARIAAPREPRPVATDLARFLADLATLAAPLQPPATRLAIEAAPFPGPLMLDAGALQDMLVNLILNARDALGPGGGTIRLAARPIRDTWLELVVEDDGPGFTAEALRHAFDPFFTTKGAAGSGLGLSMVYDATRSAGGTARVANRPEGGARVTLRLPLRPAPAAAPPRLVLLVEDEPVLRTEVREMLTGLGHRVVEAATADEALALAEIPGIDLVLSDISLAGPVTGVGLIEALAARGHGAGRLMMTSLPMGHPLHRRARALAPVLAKPFEAADLARALAAGAGP